MNVHSPMISYTDAFALLDDEFDKIDNSPENVVPVECHHKPAPVVDDLAWDDQLDNGQEMSL